MDWIMRGASFMCWPRRMCCEVSKRIRLTRAREMLERCETDGSVVQIALKCGFQNPGHFARDFRLAFGELPSETLKRGRPPPRLRQ